MTQRWLEQYRTELHSLLEAGDVRAIRKKNMELNNRLEYVKDEGEKEMFLTALYETEDVLRECREVEKLRNGLTEYREEDEKEKESEAAAEQAPGVKSEEVLKAEQQRREVCLRYYEEERYDKVYLCVKEMIESGGEFDPENNWTDTCLLVVYTSRGIHYGELQSNLENLAEMRNMVLRVDGERRTERTKQDVKVLYTLECMYMKALFHAGRYIGACYSIPKKGRDLYVCAILQIALEAGGRVQKEVWEELLKICGDEKEDKEIRDDLMRLIINRLSATEYYEEALYFLDHAITIFGLLRRKDASFIGKNYVEIWGSIERKLKKERGRELFRCLEAVVKRGGINMAYQLGNCYYNGTGCDRDFNKAKLYYEMATKGKWKFDSEQGIRCCMKQFELKHALEVLKTDNFAQAVDTIQSMAYAMGLGVIPDAQYEYARILEQGRYRKKDEYEAFVLYGCAAGADHKEAQKRFSEMKRNHPEYWEWFESDEDSYYKVGADYGWNIVKNL